MLTLLQYLRYFARCIPAAATLLVLLTVLPAVMAAEPAGTVNIRADFAGGNIVVKQNAAGRVQLEPALRGDNAWFYWCFEAEATAAGRVEFQFPAKTAGFKDGAIGFQGPAVSTDGGQQWNWQGGRNISGSAFFYQFTSTGQKVRFAVTIPYTTATLQQFVKKHAVNPVLKTSVLTRSRDGREVELLQIGDATGRQPVLVTARHHANETIASYVLEGFLQEAMSDSAAGKAFRKKYVLFAVPLVDKDGVEKGDQGKRRKPHDHNRDYGEKSIYPEIRAIKALDHKHDFKFALDFHCPTLVMPDHQVMYFVGARKHPPHNFENVSELAGWIKKGLPPKAPFGPLVWLRDETAPSPKNSRYFGFKKDAIMAATLEIPFAPPGKLTSVAACRKYGAVILQAWVQTHFR